MVPYSCLDAPAAMIPKRPVITLNRGIIGSCHTGLPRFLLKREKSEMLTASVEKPPKKGEYIFKEQIKYLLTCD